MQPESEKLIRRKTGDWWQDERRHWCAYCGRSLLREGKGLGKQIASKDHVIAKSHGGTVTIPCCVTCNKAKGNRSTAEFLTSPYFERNRGKHPGTEWSLRDLWLVMALAAVGLAHSKSDEWPVGSG